MAQPKGSILGALLGLVAFFLTGVIGGFAYVLLMAQGFGRRGLEDVGAIAFMPILGLAIGVLWLALNWFLTRRSGPLPSGRAALYGAVLGLAVGMLLAGPRGFTPAGGSALVNYFTIGIGALGAWLHCLLARRTTG